MSSCSFQTQLMSIMELLAKAAISEIHRHVDDNCAFMRVELSRSRKDIDALKRKCVMMESELRRVKGRAKRRVWISGTLDRYPTPLRTGCVRDDDDDVIRDEDPEPILNIHQEVVSVQDDKIRSPSIKNEKEQGGGNAQFDLERLNLQHIEPQENIESQKALSEDPEVQNTSFIPTQTYAELAEQVELDEELGSDLGLQVKVEKDIKEEGNLKTEGSESSMGPGDHLRYELVQRDAQLWPSVPEPSRDIQRFSTPNTSIFSQPDNTKPHRKNFYRVERTQNTEIHNMLHESKTSRSLSPAYGGAVRRLRSRRRWSVDGVKQFSCSFCEKSFKRFSLLKEHLRSHTGEKPFTCTQCGRSFTKNCNLTRHAVVHSGEKPFQCVQCGKCFSQRSHLNSHQRIHSSDEDNIRSC
ncbi:uncharacterized protein [Misgurnus anguillicaudatus]|uniref:uncharacterized protein isoform X3 n=1 Tax=Misgurnus anguillicaudatus TaxID=75329 RepID=UPI003CCF7F1F